MTSGSAPASATVELSDVVRRFRSGFQLGPITTSLSAGLTFLLGQNGAGKSTLFNLIAGDDKPTAGHIELPSRPHDSARVGYLAQSVRLPTRTSISDYLYYAAWFQGVPRSDRSAALTRALDLTQLSGRGRQSIGRLSGGTKRRVAIAAAIIHSPAVLLLDEPTNGLDPAQRIRLREVIDTLAEDRIVLLSTHLIEDISAMMAQRVIILKEGKVSFSGAGTKLMKATERPASTDLEKSVAQLMGSDE